MKRLTFGTVCLLLSIVLAIGYAVCQTVPQINNSIFRDIQHSNLNTTAENSVVENSILPPPINFPTLKAITSGSYTFSGGEGTVGNPFLISTPNDLIALSNAVNSKATYRVNNGTPQYYYNSYYKLTQDIDFSTLVSGTFIICTKTVTTTRYGGTQTVLVQQYIIKANNDAFPLTCNRVADDNNTGTVTIDSETDEKNYTSNNSPANNYTTTFKYEYYGNTPLAQSALMAPIGYCATFVYTDGNTYIEGTVSVPFAGNFNGDNHTISNIEIITQSSSSGLFGFVDGDSNPAVIQNLHINNAYISSPENSYAGGIAAIISNATIEDCSISNSTIIGNLSGGVGSTLAYSESTDRWGNVSRTSVGSISGCTSANNVIKGTSGAGGIAGSTVDKTDKIENCTSSNNDITADDEDSTGPITGSVKAEEDQGSNTVITTEEAANMTGSSFIDIIEKLLRHNNIPDFCYINNGISFNPNNSVDATILARLKAELNGSSDITDNLVLPNVANIENLISLLSSPTDAQLRELCATSYAEHIEFSNENVTNAVSASSAFNTNRYTYNSSTGTYTPSSGSSTPATNTQYYFRVIENDVETYYKYKRSNYPYYWTTVYFTKDNEARTNYSVSNGTAYYSYYHPGWNDYPTSVQTTLINSLRTTIESIDATTIASLPDYYKLTATGTDANPIVIDVTYGGGIYDKGGQLGDKIVKLKKSLYLQNWAALGITKIEDMGMGWIDTLTMDRKVNFLSNTQDNNDMAAVDWDYSTNDWYWNYLLAKHDLPYGKGIFVWSYNTAHPLAKENNWDYTVVAKSNPILYQQGKVKAYTNTTTTNTEINDYISSLENLGSSNGSGATMGKWFLIANPYTAVMSADQILKHLTNDGTGNAIQGNCIYKYRVDSHGNGAYMDYSSGANVYAGDAFFVAISESADNPANKLSGTISDQDLYGYSYEPVVSLSKKKSALDKSETTSLPKKMTFLCADSRKGLSQMTAFRYDNASNGFDVNDAYAMLSTAEKHAVEPFFVVDDIYLRHNAFTSLPYEVPIGFSSQKEQQVTFSLIGATDSMEVYLMDAVADTIICDLNVQHEVYSIEDDDTLHFSSIGNYATIDVEEGKNEGKYKIHFGPYTVGIDDVPSTQKQIADIRIYNVNKEIHLRGERLKHVQVLNTLGQIIYEREISGDEYTFSINAISGAYIIRALNEEGLSKNTKIIVH